MEPWTTSGEAEIKARTETVDITEIAVMTEDQSADDAAPVLQTSFNLVKNIAGSGVLALPTGVSKLAEGGTTIEQAALVSFSLFLFFGILNALGFYLIGEVCAKTRTDTYVSAWKATVGEGTTWLPAIASLFLCFTGSVACTTVIGDTFTDLATAAANVPYGSVPHEQIVVGIVAFVLLPLCLLPSLAPLASASLIGVIGILMTAGAMCTRFFDGSYGALGSFHTDLQWTPLLTGASDSWMPSMASLAIFCSLLSNAFLAHYNAPSYFRALSPDAKADQSDGLRSYAQLSLLSFTAAGVIFMVIALVGYATFGAAAQPNILNNYASSDALAAVARLGVGLCVLFEFPLLERPFRETAAELLGCRDVAATWWATALSVGTIMAVSLTGLPLDTICSLSGGTGGAFLIYVAPALMVLNLAREEQTTAEQGNSIVPKNALLALASFGVFIGALGTYEASVSI